MIAASYNTLVFYLGDPGGVLATKYAAAIAALPADASTAHGIAVGQAAAADIEALRANDGRNAIISTPYGQGPAAPGLWVFAPPPSLQSAQTPWLAFMQPWTLTSAAQFRTPPPPALESAQYATDLNETRAYGALNSAVRTPEQTAIAYFWNANVINQYNQTLRDVATQHGMDLVDAVHLLAMGMMVTADAGIGLLGLEVHLPVLAPGHRDPQRRHRSRPHLEPAGRHPEPSRVPVRARLCDERAVGGVGARAGHGHH